MLRSHEVFTHPWPVDLAQSVTIDVPDAWKHKLDDAEISILPLVDDLSKTYPDGWCTYTYEHSQAPELEEICGGVNAKTPQAMGIWRQGHLLHFGFEQSPAEMNANGRALLVNSICYIARFTEDRPLVRTPSPFYSNTRLLERTAIDRLTADEHRDLNAYLDWYLGPSERESVRGLGRDEVADWYRRNGGFLRVGERGKFVIDEDLRKFDMAAHDGEFIPEAIKRWQAGGERTELARRLLERYVPTGPGAEAPPSAWWTWWEANREFLFFSDSGGCHWHLDALAQTRGIPSQELRGPDRATQPRLEPAKGTAATTGAAP